MLVHPGVVGTLGSAITALESWSRDRIERPAFRTQISLRRSRPVEGPLALATVEAGHVSARQRHPRNTLAVDVESAHPEAGLWYLVDFHQCGLRWIWSKS